MLLCLSLAIVGLRDSLSSSRKGRREQAYPSRKGEERLRVTYQNMVYIADKKTLKEVQRYALDDKPVKKYEILEGAEFTTHIILVVDNR